MDQISAHAPILIVVLPLAAAFLSPIIGRWSSRARNAVNIVALVSALLLIAGLALDVYAEGMRVYTFGAAAPDLTVPADHLFPVRIIFQIDGLSILMALTIVTVTLAGLIYSIHFTGKETGQNGFYSLLMLLFAGMSGLVFTGDMFNMFVFLEILSIAGAGLLAYRNKRPDSLEGGLKYLLISAVSATMVLFAIGILYAQYNLLSIAALAQVIEFTTLDMIAFGLLVTAFGMKLAAVPIHMWAPDAYSVAPGGITPMIYTSSATCMYALYRISFSLWGSQSDTVVIGWLLVVLGVLSMVTGVMMALQQSDIKRLIAYHAISQSGYMLLGVGVGLIVLTNAVALEAYGRAAINGGLFHLINNALYKGMLFLVAEAIFFRTGTRNLNQMGGLGHNMKWTMVFFLIGALAISGIPPANGFASKLLIYQSVFQFSPLLSIIAMFVSLLTLASFTKVFFAAFTGPQLTAYRETKEVPGSMLGGMAIMAVVIIFFSFFPGLVVDTIITPATEALIDQSGYINSVLNGVP